MWQAEIPNLGSLTIFAEVITVIKFMEVCHNHQVHTTPLAQYELLQIKVKEMIKETTERTFQIEELQKRSRTDSWKPGVYSYIDTIVLSDRIDDKQFAATFIHDYPSYESYRVQFNFNRHKLIWLEKAIKVLESVGVDAVEVVYDDNYFGKYLSNRGMSSSYVLIPTLKELFELGSEINNSLQSPLIKRLQLSGQEVAKIDPQTEKYNTMAEKMAMGSLISNIAQNFAMDLRNP